MKKYWKLLLMAAGIGIFTACEDVPEPYNIPTEDNKPTPVIAEPKGTGTLEDPFNAAAAIQAARALESGAESEQDYYIQGIVSTVGESYSTNYGNASYYISDDGSTSNQFYVYRALYLGNQKYTSGDNIEVGDTVIVCGRITNYRGNTPETVQNKAFLYSLKKGNGAPVVTPVEGLKGSGTVDDPYNTASAILIASALAKDATTSEAYFIKGKVVSVKEEFSTQWGNATFYISDDGTTSDQLYVFQILYLGNKKWKAGDKQIKEGDEVVICAKLTNFRGTTLETVKGESYIYSLNGETAGGGGETPTEGIEVTCAKAVELTNALADGATSDETYTITGYITEVVGSVSRNQQTFWMADTKDGGRVFEAYYANLPDGVSAFKAGTKVKITGQLMKYVNASSGQVIPEVKNANVVILEEGGDTPAPAGKEVTCAQAAELTSALADGASSDETYTVSGFITEVIGSVSRNQQSFWMADTQDGGKVFEAYWANLPAGVSEFKVGMKVKITGKLMKYVKEGNVTPEIKNADVEILGEGGGGVEPGPGAEGTKLADFNNGSFEAWTDGAPDQWLSTTTASTKNTVSQSTDARTGSYSVKVAGKEDGNNRLASTELALEAGEYTMKFFVKPEADGGSVRPGFVPVTDGKVGSYVYGDYTNDIPAGTWTEVTHTFTLSAATTVNLVIMNPKKPGKNFLIDDFTITKK